MLLKRNLNRVLLGAAAMLMPLFAARVSEVEVVQNGKSKLPQEQILFSVQVRPNLEFSQKSLDDDIRRLYATGNFDDVLAKSVPAADGKVKVVFTVKVKPRITMIEYKGNAKFAAKDLKKEVTLVRGGLLNDRELRESLQKLRKFYKDKGYHSAIISHALLPDGEDAVILVFQITENLRQRVNDVKFENATVYSQRELRNMIATQYSYVNLIPFVNDFLNLGLLDRAELERDRARLREAYHNKGYLDFKITDVKITPKKGDPEYQDVTFVFSEGKPYVTGKISISGNTVYSQKDLTPLIALQKGKAYSRADEERTVREIGRLYDTLGYADLNTRAVRTPDVERHTVDVAFKIDEGRKYTVRDVVIIGNTQTKDKVIRRELAIQPGDPVDRARIEASQQRLMGMGYFKKVEASAVGADALDEKDVQIHLQENPERYRLRFGVGYSDINSITGMVELSCNNFDIANPKNWFYGGGQRFRLQGLYGKDNGGFNVSFIEPWLFDIPLRLEVSGYMNEVDYDNWDESRAGVRFSLGKKVFDDFTTLTVGYKFEYVRVHNVSSKLEDYFDHEDLDGGFFVSQPSIMLDRDTRDDLINPTSGYNINLFASITPRYLGSTCDYMRMEAKGSYYCSFWDKAIIAMVGAKVGTIYTFGSGDAPVYDSYFLGGGDSMRGFGYRSISPLINDEAVGGQSMALFTTEVSHPIYGPVRGAVFCDVGNVWGSAFEMGRVNIGAGYGIRIKLPVLNAPIKLDLAYPVLDSRSSEGSKLRFHFNMGFTF